MKRIQDLCINNINSNFENHSNFRDETLYKEIE